MGPSDRAAFLRLNEGGVLCVELKCMVNRIFAVRSLAVVAVVMRFRAVRAVHNLKA